MTRLASILLLCACWLSQIAPASAHKASDAYLTLREAGVDSTGLQISIAVKDLDAVFDALDADNDRQITWGEIKRATPEIARWVGDGIAFTCAEKSEKLPWNFESIEQRSDGAYLRFASTLRCPSPSIMALDYALFRDVDATHRLIIAGAVNGQPVAAALSPNGRSRLQLSNATATDPSVFFSQTGLITLAQFFPAGVEHILTGFDHLAFLLALLLPIVFYQRNIAAISAAGALALVRTVTGFTIGHSVTLLLANLGWINASPAWVEPAIALTIAISAALNLKPVPWIRSEILALGFGLIHGLGFSGVMSEAGVSGSLLLWGLAGFNLGVEAGQLAVVAVWCILHLFLARWSHYQAVVVRGGSYALILVASYWMVQRVL